MAVNEKALEVMVDIIGIEALQKRLEQFEPRLRKKRMSTLLRKVIEPVSQKAKAKAPVDTGTLRKYISKRKAKLIKPPGRYTTGIAIKPGTRAKMGIDPDDKWYYPAILEYGAPDIGIAPRRFLREALYESEDSVRRNFKAELRKSIDQTAKELREGIIDSKGKRIKK